MNQSSEPWSLRRWAIILHLSQLANFLIPLSGFILPIVIWQMKEDQINGLDAHGKVVANWLISSFLYSIAFFILSFALIGISLLFILGLLAICFPIYGAIKASDGELWSYPLSIRFIT